MKKTWLILDMSNLGWRAFHSIKTLSYEGQSVGIIYGLLRDIRNLMDMHATTRVAFCFDYGKSKRKEIDKNYKRKRHERELTQEEEAAYQDMKKQMDLMRTIYLKDLGFKNIFWQDGYEGDDIIASLTKSALAEKDEAVIVSSDKDMLQLLRENVCIWKPVEKECVTLKSFRKKWIIHPEHWANVKAMAGCETDEVEGIPGIGDLTASRYMLDIHNAYRRIDSPKVTNRVRQLMVEYNELIIHNLRLVELPLEGTKLFTLKEDKVKSEAWKKLTAKLGMKSLVGRAPGMTDGFGLKPKRVKE